MYTCIHVRIYTTHIHVCRKILIYILYTCQLVLWNKPLKGLEYLHTHTHTHTHTHVNVRVDSNQIHAMPAIGSIGVGWGGIIIEVILPVHKHTHTCTYNYIEIYVLSIYTCTYMYMYIPFPNTFAYDWDKHIHCTCMYNIMYTVHTYCKYFCIQWRFSQYLLQSLNTLRFCRWLWHSSRKGCCQNVTLLCANIHT